MNCPACSRELREVAANGVTVDTCDGGCGGIWFDNRELRAVDQPHEPCDDTLLQVARDPYIYVDETARRRCPRCTEEIILMRRFTSPDKRVAIDECAGCGGVFLDAGELAELRSEYADDEERRNAADTQVKQAFAQYLARDAEAAVLQKEAAERRSERFRDLATRGGGSGSSGFFSGLSFDFFSGF